MADNETLMAYLVPRLTRQVENAATDALAYILNKSAPARDALNDLLRESDFDIAPVVRVETQVTYEDGSIPDMVGYDNNGAKRLLVEAKFWATLLEGQASGYVEQFDHDGQAVLLLISPEVRTPTLWAEVERQIAKRGGQLDLLDSASGIRRARLVDTERHIMLISWTRLLDAMAIRVGDAGVAADIQQLRGLAQSQDSAAFLPMGSEDMNPSLGRRAVWFGHLVDDAVSEGVRRGWLNTKGLYATSQRYGYGRYARFSGSDAVWFGVNHERWARSGDTPLWILMNGVTPSQLDEIASALNVRRDENWIPIHPELGVEYSDVLADVAEQLRRIGKILGDSPAGE